MSLPEQYQEIVVFYNTLEDNFLCLSDDTESANDYFWSDSDIEWVRVPFAFDFIAQHTETFKAAGMHNVIVFYVNIHDIDDGITIDYTSGVTLLKFLRYNGL